MKINNAHVSRNCRLQQHFTTLSYDLSPFFAAKTFLLAVIRQIYANNVDYKLLLNTSRHFQVVPYFMNFLNTFRLANKFAIIFLQHFNNVLTMCGHIRARILSYCLWVSFFLPVQHLDIVSHINSSRRLLVTFLFKVQHGSESKSLKFDINGRKWNWVIFA